MFQTISRLMASLRSFFPQPGAQGPARFRSRPSLEALEARQVLSTISEVHYWFASGEWYRQLLSGGKIEGLFPTAGEQGYLQYGCRLDDGNGADYLRVVYDFDLYLSPDKMVDAGDRVVWHDAMASWGSPVLGLSSFFNFPDRNDAVYQGAERHVSSYDGHTSAGMYSNLRIRNRETGQEFWAEVGYSDVTLTAAPAKPDVRLDTLAIDGDVLQIGYMVTGKLPKDDLTVRVAWSLDGAYSSDDTALANVRLKGSQLTAGSHNVSVPIGPGSGKLHLPGAGADPVTGDYYVVAQADPTNAVAEASEENNGAATRPDIRVSKVRFNDSSRSVAFDLSARDIPRDVTVRLYQSSSAKFSLASARELARQTVGANQVQGVFNLSSGPLVRDGNYLFVVADPDNRQWETNERNNVARCEPDVQLVGARFDGTIKKVAFDYQAWNLSDAVEVRLYQSDRETFDRSRSTELSRRSCGVRSTSGSFSLLTAPRPEDGKYLFVVADPDNKTGEANKQNGIARLDLPKTSAARTDLFQIRINRGVELGVGPLTAQGIEFIIEEILPDGSAGESRKLKFFAAGKGVNVKVPFSVLGTTDWLKFHTAKRMALDSFQGSGFITTLPGVSAGPLGTNTRMFLKFNGAGDQPVLFFKDNGDRTSWLYMSVSGNALGVTVFQATGGEWTISK